MLGALDQNSMANSHRLHQFGHLFCGLVNKGKRSPLPIAGKPVQSSFEAESATEGQSRDDVAP